MKLVKCKNGHFYDAEKNASCPHCQRSAQKEGDIPTEAMTWSTTGAGQTEPESAGVTEAFHEDHTPKPAQKPVQPEPQEVKKPVGQSRGQEDNNTVGYYSRTMGTEPVVGWLVCTEGDYFGESFKLKSGRNFIGRSSGMDIVLSADRSVSRNRHAIIIYEPKKRMFIAQPGESRELFYLNDDVVLSNVEMHAYDVLSIGTTKLMLIPCCGERFSWDDLKKEEE